jgi:Flp pilus assembly protein TadD
VSKQLLLTISLVAVLTGCQSFTATLGPPNEEPFVSTNEPGYLGQQYFARGNYALAEQNFRTAVERNPAEASAWMGLAASYDQLGRFELADRAYDQATKLSGTTYDILNNRGFSYLLRGDASRAAALLQRARALRPQDPVVSNNLTLLSQART